MHQSFSGQLCKCLQDDSDKGEGEIGGKQLETELSNLGCRSNVVAHESEDGNQAQLQSNRCGQTCRENYQKHNNTCVKPGDKNQMLGTHVGFEISMVKLVNNMFFIDTH